MEVVWADKQPFMAATGVMPHPPPRRMMGMPHGIETSLIDFLSLVGPFRSYFHNYINLENYHRSGV